VLEGPQWPDGSLVPFQLGLGPAGRTLSDGNTSWDNAAAPAVVAWNAVVGQLVLQANVGAHPPISSGDGVNAVAFSSTVFGDSFGSRTLAVTTFRSAGSTIVEADVLFNNHQTFDSYRGPLRSSIADIRRVFIHELGHAIGLDHPDDHGQHVDAIMNSMISNRETLSPDDIAGAQVLYGAGSTDIARADFNRDGFADYLLFNPGTGQTALWYLRSSVFSSSAYGPALPAGWIVSAVADLDRDGRPDYLLFNPGTGETAVWYLDNTVFISVDSGPTLPPNWELIAAVDMNGDGHPDYVLFNTVTYQTAVWFLNNITYIGSAWGPTFPAGWSLVDANDFNGDGRRDFLLFNASTHRTALWYLIGTALAGTAYGPTLPAGWTLQGSADFDRDGHIDYVLVNGATRQTAIWFLNGAVFARSAYGPTLAVGYKLVAP
jgi:Matrixin/FG-GAP-like repeat